MITFKALDKTGEKFAGILFDNAETSIYLGNNMWNFSYNEYEAIGFLLWYFHTKSYSDIQSHFMIIS